MKYIVSVVMTKVTAPEQPKGIINGSAQKNHQFPDISLQNVVGVCTADSAEEAYEKLAARARLMHPDHKIAVRVVVETTAADLDLEQ